MEVDNRMEKVTPIHLLRPNYNPTTNKIWTSINHASESPTSSNKYQYKFSIQLPTNSCKIKIKTPEIIMPYKPIIPIRRSIRIPEYDYTQQGAYFITICTHRKENIFGEIKSGKMKLSPLGEIAYYQWLHLPIRFNNIELDAFVIMPNHIHGIIIITKNNNPTPRRGEAGENRHGSPPKNPISPASPVPSNHDSPRAPTASPSLSTNSPPPHGTVPGSIGAIIQNYKSLTTRKINLLQRTKNETIWQRNFYEHIIRDETDFDRIVDYIHNNPIAWSDDKYFSE